MMVGYKEEAKGSLIEGRRCITGDSTVWEAGVVMVRWPGFRAEGQKPQATGSEFTNAKCRCGAPGA